MSSHEEAHASRNEPSGIETPNATNDGEEREAENRIVDGVMANLRECIKDEVKKALQASKREITQMSAEACSSAMSDLTAKAAKAARMSDDKKLKKKGNQKQFKHNREVLDEIEGAERALDEGNIARVKERLTNGKISINKRFKHIRLADRGELGWQVVNYYESDELASDSDDEKSINRARREAAAQVKKREAKKKDNKSASSRSRNSEYNSSFGSRRGRTSLICFSCNREGHVSRNCFRISSNVGNNNR